MHVEIRQKEEERKHNKKSTCFTLKTSKERQRKNIVIMHLQMNQIQKNNGNTHRDHLFCSIASGYLKRKAKDSEEKVYCKYVIILMPSYQIAFHMLVKLQHFSFSACILFSTETIEIWHK